MYSFHVVGVEWNLLYYCDAVRKLQTATCIADNVIQSIFCGTVTVHVPCKLSVDCMFS